jgi:hypothetical protein
MVDRSPAGAHGVLGTVGMEGEQMSDSISFEFDERGLAHAYAVLDTMEREVQEPIATSLGESFEIVLARSKQEFVPIDTGFLSSTGFVLVDRSGSDIVARIGFTADYAAAVHETNKNYKGGRQWKYLETPMKESLPDIAAKCQADLKRWIESL